MLDYICGISGRKPQDFVMSFVNENDEAKLSEIKVRESDRAFSTLIIDDQAAEGSLLVAPNNMKVIGKSLADAVLELTEEKLKSVLEKFGLSDTEIIPAITRTNILKSKIQNNEITVIDDDKWNELNIDTAVNDNNYFGFCKNMKNKATELDQKKEIEKIRSEKSDRMKEVVFGKERKASNIADQPIDVQTESNGSAYVLTENDIYGIKAPKEVIVQLRPDEDNNIRKTSGNFRINVAYNDEDNKHTEGYFTVNSDVDGKIQPMRILEIYIQHFPAPYENSY